MGRSAPFWRLLVGWWDWAFEDEDVLERVLVLRGKGPLGHGRGGEA